MGRNRWYVESEHVNGIHSMRFVRVNRQNKTPLADVWIILTGVVVEARWVGCLAVSLDRAPDHGPTRIHDLEMQVRTLSLSRKYL